MNPPPGLILAAACGDGHNAAARGLASAIQLRGGTAVVADPFAESRPKLNDFFRRLYLTLINRYPHLWNLFYLACHHLPLIENTLFTNRPAYLQLRSLIETHRPKVIALTFPVYAHLIAWVPHDLRKTFQLITIVTDSISVHRLWSSAKADLWIVPNEPTARSLHALGIPMDKIRPIGFPVDPRFAAPTAHPGDEPPGEAPRILYLLSSGLRGGPDLQEIGVAQLTPNGETAVRIIRHALAENGKGWKEWKAKLAAASRPDACLRLADLCLSLNS